MPQPPEAKTAIYPTPKSYDQLMKDKEAAEKLRLERLPKHVILPTALKTYGVLVALNVAVAAIPVVFQFGIIAGVFLCFLIGMMWFGCLTWAAKSIIDTFQKLDANANPFFALYVVIFPPMAFTAYKLTEHALLLITFATITGLHFLFVYLLVKLIVN